MVLFQTTTKGGVAVLRLMEKALDAIMRDPKIWGIVVAIALIAVLVGDVRRGLDDLDVKLAAHIAHDESATVAQNGLLTTLIQLSRQSLNVDVQRCIDSAEGPARSQKVSRCLAAQNGADPR